MGQRQNELALALEDFASEKEAVVALNKRYAPNSTQWNAERQEIKEFFRPVFEQDRKNMPTGNLYVPTERELRVGHGLGSDYAIDPETGLIVPLNAQAAERMQVEADTSGSSSGSKKRFPCGSAVVIGITKAGKLVSKVFTLGAASAKPYTTAAKRAAEIVHKGGIALYGAREAGYELHDKATGKRWDPTTPKPEAFDLRPARDRRVGKRQVVGVAGDKGLSLIDASTMAPVRPQKALEWYTWLVACGETQAAERLAIFVRKPKISQKDFKLSQDAANAMVDGTPYHERPFIQRYAVGMVDRLNMSTREIERLEVRVDIGCSSVDCSLPVESSGLKYNLYWGTSFRTPEMAYDPDEGWTASYAETNPSNHEACDTHALELAKHPVGESRPLFVEWTDTEGTHRVTRDEALRSLTDKDEDEVLNQVRYGYNSKADPESYALELCEALDMSSGSNMRHQRDDEWWAAHELARECTEALATTLKDADEEDRQKVAEVRAKAEAEKQAIMRKLVPGYVKPGTVNTKGPRREVNHDWPVRNARSKNSRGTWNSRAHAQGLHPSWRKNHSE